MPIIAKEAGAEDKSVSIERVPGGGWSCGGIPAISSIWEIDRFSGVPLHSRALMPNKDVKKDSGRKLRRLV
jgi:hypothetical protein